jgi:hypothetical protein
MKNAIDLVKDLHDCYDLAINEQCQTYDECGDLQTYFSDKGKSVLQVEYTDMKGKDFCKGATKYGMKTKYCRYKIISGGVACYRVHTRVRLQGISAVDCRSRMGGG